MMLNPDLQFLFSLAETLSMPVQRVLAEVSYKEMLGWSAFWSKRAAEQQARSGRR